jgi:ubiquinone biosynthesis protein Coq4
MDIRNKIMEWMAYKLYFPFIRLVYKPQYDAIQMQDLLLCPQGSLGNEAYHFLKQRNISLFHGYEVHDLKHVLLNIEMTIKGEIELEYFELGNGNRSIVVWVVILGGTLVMPEKFKEYRKSYLRGKASKKLENLKLEEQLQTPIEELRESMGVHVWLVAESRIVGTLEHQPNGNITT